MRCFGASFVRLFSVLWLGTLAACATSSGDRSLKGRDTFGFSVQRPCADVYRSIREGATACFQRFNFQVDSTWHEGSGEGHVTVRTQNAQDDFLTADVKCRSGGMTAVLVVSLEDPEWRARSAWIEPWAKGEWVECR